MHLQTNSPFRIMFSAFVLACCFAISSWAATIMPNGAALEEMCDNSLACSVIDETWPKNKTFSCASVGVILKTSILIFSLFNSKLYHPPEKHHTHCAR
jgi:hypothetical protein